MRIRVLAVTAVAALTVLPTRAGGRRTAAADGAGRRQDDVLAQGVATPTAFAFLGDADVRRRVRGRGAPQGHRRACTSCRGGKAKKIPGSPAHVMGLAVFG